MPRISLEAARVNARLTQKQAAEQLGVSEKTVYDWEHGKRLDKISWVMLEKIENTYGIDKQYLNLQ